MRQWEEEEGKAIWLESSLSSQLSSLSVGSGEAIVEKLSSFVIYGHF